MMYNITLCIFQRPQTQQWVYLFLFCFVYWFILYDNTKDNQEEIMSGVKTINKAQSNIVVITEFCVKFKLNGIKRGQTVGEMETWKTVRSFNQIVPCFEALRHSNIFRKTFRWVKILARDLKKLQDLICELEKLVQL